MKREELKVGNVIETKEGKKFIVAYNKVDEFVIRTLNTYTFTTTWEGYLKQTFDEDLKYLNREFPQNDIVAVYEDISVFVIGATPIWEADPLEFLPYNSIILVKDNEDDYFRIKFFKGVKNGYPMAASTREATISGAYGWDQYQLLDDKEVENAENNDDIVF